MAVECFRFWRTKEFLMGGEISLLNDNLGMALLAPGFVYEQEMVQLSDVASLEIAHHADYLAGGIDVPGKDLYTNDVTGRAEFRIGECVYTSVDATVRCAVMYADIVAYGINKPLLTYCDFGVDLVFDYSVFKFQWPYPIMRW